ncbi:MAG: DUF2868 domain-containing protein [Telluria sp.]
MNEQVARDVVLVRAIETSDTAHEVLSDDDRNYASRSARELAAWQAADSKSEPTLDHFLEQRSGLVLKRLAERHASFAHFLRRRTLLPALSVLLPLLALIAGAGLDRIADPHRVDLLSAPLLLIIGWNLLVYLILIAWLFVPGRQTGWLRTSLVQRLSVGKPGLPRKLPAVLSAGLFRYLQDWTSLSAALTRTRVSRAIHLAAACFALGAVLSLYARGLLTQYAAGWESTFLDARQVHALLSILFAPAMLVLPLQGFSLADIEALRFAQNASPAGGARWVHLYAATLAIIVIVPRLALAAVAHWRANRLKQRFPLDLSGPYFLALARGAGTAGPAVLRVFPYSFTVDAARDKSLAELARAALGEQARLMLRPSCPYGEDPHELLHGELFDDPDVAATAALFNLAATPEKENHGAFLDYLSRRCPRAPAAIIDIASFAQHGADQERLAERTALWREFCRFHRTHAQFVNLLDAASSKLELDVPVSQ